MGFRVSQNWGSFVGLPIIRMIIFCGLYWGPLFGQLTCEVL